MTHSPPKRPMPLFFSAPRGLLRLSSPLLPLRPSSGRTPTRGIPLACCHTRTFMSQFIVPFQWCLTALHFLPESETLIRGNPIQARPLVAEPTFAEPIISQPILTRSIDRHPRFWRAVYAVDRSPNPRTKCVLRSPAVHRLAR